MKVFLWKVLRVVVNLFVMFTASVWVPIVFFHNAIVREDDEALDVVTGHSWFFQKVGGPNENAPEMRERKLFCLRCSGRDEESGVKSDGKKVAPKKKSRCGSLPPGRRT